MAKTPQISAKDLRGIIANFPTPVRRDIELNRHTKNAIDLDETARAADNYVRDGAAGFILCGSLGEMGSMTLDEWRDFTRAVVEAVKDRAPVFAGITTLNTRDTMERCRIARDLGAHGFNVGRPMQSPLNAENILQWHRDIIEEFPDMAIVLYDDPACFKGAMSAAVYKELAKYPQVVASKIPGGMDIAGLMQPNSYRGLLEAVDGRVKLLPNDAYWRAAYRWVGTDVCWSTAFGGSPGAVKALQDAIFAGDDATAAKIEADLLWASEGTWPAGGSLETFHVNKIAQLKLTLDTAGYVRCGPPLPPYTFAAKDRLEAAVTLGMRSRELQKKYPHKTASEATKAA